MSAVEAEQIAALAGALSHPYRVAILDRLARVGELSPRGFSADEGAPLGTVSYHFRTIAKAGLVELVRTEQRRGAIEHYYALTDRGRMAVAWLHNAPR